ncbi:hypothetical protein ACF3NT_04635 [Naumannella halotolerans]|uniref:Uncharacterized protein n=1 Tax=Naumannella halotolerans TaxID=993414 RepID=A0A4R7J7V0_9ACTN|nr:hypothetical protein [Naumannella halotolerans]TDT33335.1 hypothetical protein CLV29_0946 [Naumannella halotolerans]
MSSNPQPSAAAEPDPREHGKFSISEDWAAVVVGLALLAAALTGLIPDGVIP